MHTPESRTPMTAPRRDNDRAFASLARTAHAWGRDTAITRALRAAPPSADAVASARLLVGICSESLTRLLAFGALASEHARAVAGEARRRGCGYVAVKRSACPTAPPVASWTPSTERERAITVAARERCEAMRLAVLAACTAASIDRFVPPRPTATSRIGSAIAAGDVVPGVHVEIAGADAVVLASERRPDARVRLTLWRDSTRIVRTFARDRLLPYHEGQTARHMAQLRVRFRVARGVLAHLRDTEHAEAIRRWCVAPMLHPIGLPSLLADLYNAGGCDQLWRGVLWCERAEARDLPARIGRRWRDHESGADRLVRGGMFERGAR